MRIDIPATITARMETGRWDQNEFQWRNEAIVVVEFADVELARLAPRETISKYDSDEELQVVADRTVAYWLKEKLA